MSKKRPLTKPKNIFSAGRITRLIFVAWLLSLALTFIVVAVLREVIPPFSSLHYVVIVLILYGISTLFGITIFYFLTKKTTELTGEINNAIHKIAMGDFSARLNFEPVNKDIDAVVNNFNAMAEELNSLVILNNDFVSNFSHEFKTPIVSVKGYAELLLESKNLNDDERKYLKIIIDESKRLSMLSDSAMTLSKLDSNRVESQKSTFWLDEELSRCILLFDGRLTDKNIDFSSDIEQIKINADKNLTNEIWINLISNAIKFTPKNGKITLSAKEHGEFAFIIVSDSGKGIDEKDARKIFDRHYRGSGAENSQGNGLGLAIAKRITELHGGTIYAENSTLGGAQFVVKLPLE